MTTLRAAFLVVAIVGAHAQTNHKIEVAVVKACGHSLDDGGRSRRPDYSPGRLTLHCTTVRSLIRHAYLNFENGVDHLHDPSPGMDIKGGPAWLDSELYEITMKSEAAETQNMMQGPLLKSLLEDRFKVKVHREAIEIPVYALTVGNGGAKLRPPETACIAGQNQKPCPPAVSAKSGLVTIDFSAMSLEDFLGAIVPDVDRPIINKTGITGQYRIHLSYAPDEGAARFDPSDTAAGPSIFTALREQLGLKLEPAKGPGTVLIVDRAERPSEN